MAEVAAAGRGHSAALRRRKSAGSAALSPGALHRCERDIPPIIPPGRLGLPSAKVPASFRRTAVPGCTVSAAGSTARVVMFSMDKELPPPPFRFFCSKDCVHWGNAQKSNKSSIARQQAGNIALTSRR